MERIKNMTWLIDDRGVRWPSNMHPIACWGTACDPVGFAVSDLGFIHVRPLNGAMTVSFNPSRVGRPTMIGAFYLIAGERPKRIALSYGSKCPNLEILGTVGEALRRIEKLVETHPPPIPVFSQRPRSLDRLPKHITEPIMELLRSWSNTVGRWTPERHTDLCTVVPSKDTVVARNPRGTDRLVNYHWGASFDFVGPRWAQIARGKDVEDQPFPELGKRIASLYRRTLADGKPHLHEIDLALLRAGCTMLRRRYTRLTLPWSEPGGDRYVTVIRFDKNIPTT